MQATELIIGDHTYLLPPDVDASDVLEQLTAAVRAGGGVVGIPSGSEGNGRAVLVSPGVPIFIERIPIPDETLDAGNDGDDGFMDWLR